MRARHEQVFVTEMVACRSGVISVAAAAWHGAHIGRMGRDSNRRSSGHLKQGIKDRTFRRVAGVALRGHRCKYSPQPLQVGDPALDVGQVTEGHGVDLAAGEIATVDHGQKGANFLDAESEPASLPDE
jgi:hypothetical protein